MKNTLTIFSLLIVFCFGSSAQAQKAYDVITYRAIVYGNQSTLQLADGYLLASKVTIRSIFGDQIFSPLAGEPDAQGNLRFEKVKSTGRYQNNKGSWLVLKKINGPDYPSQIAAVYWDGKAQKAIVFKQLN